ncbi:MAG: type IV secretion system DNA-binding domain-containing protein [Rhodocyclaceae bacterium]|nr:type IV secretion system DNA-binding domain-containing protein [Rhodocyclaceae bacterium]
MDGLRKLPRLAALIFAYSLAIFLLLAIWLGLPPLTAAGISILFGGVTALAVEYIQISARETSAPAHIHIGSVPIPREIEGRHFLIAGTTGVGKSQAIFGMVRDARARGDRGLALDVGGAYVSRFLQPGDLVLSPGDARSVKWNPFKDLDDVFSYASFSRAVIPDGTGDQGEWRLYGQNLLSAVLKSLHHSGDWSVSRLLHLFCNAEPRELKPILAGTPAAILTQDENTRYLGSTRGVTSNFLVPLSFLPDGGDFSIKDWVRNSPNGQWLFLPYRDNQIAALRSLLTCWLQLAISETLSLDERTARQTWFIADEFDTLGKVSAAKDALTKLRKYRGSCVFGLQSVSQLRATYGRDEAQTLLACLSSKLYLRQGDPETAKYCSDDLGQSQILRTEKSSSKRTGLGGDGNETSAERHVTEAIVMPSELQNLPDLDAYLSLAGDYPIARVRIPIPHLSRIAEPFVEEA